MVGGPRAVRVGWAAHLGPGEELGAAGGLREAEAPLAVEAARLASGVAPGVAAGHLEVAAGWGAAAAHLELGEGPGAAAAHLVVVAQPEVQLAGAAGLVAGCRGQSWRSVVMHVQAARSRCAAIHLQQAADTLAWH